MTRINQLRIQYNSSFSSTSWIRESYPYRTIEMLRVDSCAFAHSPSVVDGCPDDWLSHTFSKCSCYSLSWPVSCVGIC